MDRTQPLGELAATHLRATGIRRAAVLASPPRTRLGALRATPLHWLGVYDPDQHGSAPIGWHRDFADARQWLRDWVAISGTRLERDRSTRQTAWPGEPPAYAVEDVVIGDRDEDFVQFVVDDVARRRDAEASFYSRAESS